jgi:hypothetical protein
VSRTAEPRPGQHAWFIRYVSSRDGWTPETIRGDIEERTETGWLLRVGADVQHLSNSEWSLYHP